MLSAARTSCLPTVSFANVSHCSARVQMRSAMSSASRYTASCVNAGFAIAPPETASAAHTTDHGQLTTDTSPRHDPLHLRHLHDLLRGSNPVQHFQAAVGEEALHAAREGGLADLVGGGALEGHVPDFAVHDHHLEDADAAAEADAVAVLAAAGLVDGAVLHVLRADARQL